MLTEFGILVVHVQILHGDGAGIVSLNYILCCSLFGDSIIVQWLLWFFHLIIFSETRSLLAAGNDMTATCIWVTSK